MDVVVEVGEVVDVVDVLVVVDPGGGEPVERTKVTTE